ncbi:MAG: hypothetical protein KF764_29995 [Labilithrix sp.]|nr:hypothetical protein [Labilithrix sp.]MBX3221382.1 hypothetical protein [Labilithrix sp.]
MSRDDETATVGTADAAPAPSVRKRRPLSRLAFLVFGLLVALYLGTLRPQEQHVRVVLGAGAPEVTAVDLEYVAADGEIAREAHFAYPAGAAPRVVAHEPQLPNGEYRLQIEVDARGGRRGIQRQVTLGGGSTQVDVSSALAREP